MPSSGPQNVRRRSVRATKPVGDLHTLRQALRKYSDEISLHRKGERWEQVRLSAFESYLLPLELPISEVMAQHVAAFQDVRSKKIGPSLVLREMGYSRRGRLVSMAQAVANCMLVALPLA